MARLAVAVGVVFGLGLALLFRGPLGGGATASSAAVVVGQGVRSVAGLVVGDCLMLRADDGSDIARSVRCDEPHHAEIMIVERYGSNDAALPYPSEPEFAAWADRECASAFRSYAGGEVASQSELAIGVFVPSESAWDRGDRRMTCFLEARTGSLTSSQRSTSLSP